MPTTAKVEIPLSFDVSTASAHDASFIPPPSPITDAQVRHAVAREVGGFGGHKCSKGAHVPPTSATWPEGTFVASLLLHDTTKGREPLRVLSFYSAKELLATLMEMDFASAFESDGTTATSDTFFWLDMHGVPAPGAHDDSLRCVWEVLGLDVDSVRRLNAILAKKQDSLLQKADDANTRLTELPGLVDMYARDDDVDASDTVAVHRRVLHDADSNRQGARPLMKSVGGVYVAMEMATLLETQTGRVQDSQELQSEEAAPVITATYVHCFRGGCVTWCPESRPLESLDIQERSSDTLYATAVTAVGMEALTTPLQRHVSGWLKLQEAVLASIEHDPYSPFPTASFVSLLLSTVCYAYLPDTTAVLNEVDAIDAMLPLIVPDKESDQADALRRVLVLRRRLAVHRRLLFRKVKLLQELHKPVMLTLADFMNPEALSIPHSPSSPLRLAKVSQPSFKGMEVRSAPRPDAYGNIRIAILQVLAKLDSARVILGNTTIIYTSAVGFRNSTTSTSTDYFQLLTGFTLAVMIPMSIVVTHWGMNCHVPWQDATDTTAPFWGIVGIITAISVVTLVYPVWAYMTGRVTLLT